MKNLVLVFFVFAVHLNVAAQSSLFSTNNIKNYANWGIANNEAVWQYVFTSKTNDKKILTDLLTTFLKQNPSIQNIRVKDNGIVADVSKLKIDFKKYGGSTRYTSQSFINGLWNGKLKIDVVNGSYDVILQEVSFESDSKNASNGAASKTSWTNSVLNKDHKTFKDIKKVDLDFFNKVLLDIFDLRK